MCAVYVGGILRHHRLTVDTKAVVNIRRHNYTTFRIPSFLENEFRKSTALILFVQNVIPECTATMGKKKETSQDESREVHDKCVL